MCAKRVIGNERLYICCTNHGVLETAAVAAGETTAISAGKTATTASGCVSAMLVREVFGDELELDVELVP